MTETLPEIREAPEVPVQSTEARDEAAARVAAAFVEENGLQVEGGEPPAPESTAETPPEPEAPEPELVLDPQVEDADEFSAWLDEPDENDVTAEELAPALSEEEEPVYGEFETESDPRVLEERRARIAAEKRAEHYERLRAQDARKGWAAEAAERFPLAQHVLDTIDATSKKGYMRAARDEHQRILPYVQAYIEQAKGVVTAQTETAKTEAQTEVANAWGQPTTDMAPTEAAERQSAIDSARQVAAKSGSLRSLFSAMLQDKPL